MTPLASALRARPGPRLPSLIAALLLLAPLTAQGGTVKVFVLAGQSNMEGKANNELFEHQAQAPETAQQFAHLRTADGDAWAVRDDVFVEFLGRRGRLTLGFGSPGRTGCELELGTVLGERYDEPVLLIKTAWGGHSLYRQFRPPSAGLPDQEALDQELAQARERVRGENEKHGRDAPLPTMAEIEAAYGSSYRLMLQEVRAALGELGQRFPELQGRDPELCGFVWFQGWNDQYGGVERRYGALLKQLIVDLRRDLGAPDLPVVVGVMGQNGSQPATGAMQAIQQAQLGIEDDAQLRGSVRAVRTDVLVDEAAERLYPEWKQRFEEWQRTGSDHRYHYLGSAIWFTRIGRAFAEAMLELLGDD